MFITQDTLGADEASMLTHTYLTKPLEKIKVAICSHQTDSPLHMGAKSLDLVFHHPRVGRDVVHDTECSY